MHENGKSRWNRRVYPLQIPTKGYTTPNPATPLPEQKQIPPSDQPLLGTQATNQLGPWHRDVYPRQSSTEDPVPEYPSTLPREERGNLSSAAHLGDDGTTDEINASIQYTSPVQSFTEISVPQRFHTPQAEKSNLPPAQLPRNQQDGARNKVNQWNRQTYPIQLSTEVSEPQSSPTLAPKEEHTPIPNEEDKRLPVQASGSTRSGLTNVIDPWARSTYPLQSTAESSTPEDLAMSMPKEEHKPPSIQDSGSNQDGTAKRKSPWNRQGYPLQSATEASASQILPTPLQENGRTTPRQTGDKDESAPIHHSEDNQNTVEKRASLWNRQVYPLQPSTCGSTTQYSPTSPLSEKESEKEDTPPSDQFQEKNRATNGTNQWHRQLYPLQSPTSGSTSQYLATPPSYEQKPEKDYKPRPIQLPKYIRAAENAEKTDHTGRTIVVCLDGTGDKFDSDNSNIVHLVSCLKKDDPLQVTYYQAGIGTYGAGGLSSGVTAALDMAVGSGLGLHVRDAYHFLMHTYKEGDKICIFGFSRGAYTARCLAGMVHKVGLLPPRNIQQIPFAYEFYANATPEGWRQSGLFKKTFSIDVSVYFVGAFDSVASVGFIPRQLPLSSTPTSKPRYFRHAMALDERRAKFKICRHEAKDWDNIENSTAPSSPVSKLTQSLSNLIRPNSKSPDGEPPSYSQHSIDMKHHYARVAEAEYERLTGHDKPYDTDVLEVWFLGAHADVGGGAVKDKERHKLSHIPLRWMIRQCFECNTGIIFKTKVLAEHGLDVHLLWPKYEKLNVPVHAPLPSLLEKYEHGLPPRSVRRSKLVPFMKHEKGEILYDLKIFGEDKSHLDGDWTPEQVEDFFDAMSDPNDQLLQVPSWWILEVWPVAYKLPKGDLHEFYTKVGMNMGRYRAVEDFEPRLHWTVLHRMRHKGYKINARTAKYSQWRAVV